MTWYNSVYLSQLKCITMPSAFQNFKLVHTVCKRMEQLRGVADVVGGKESV